MKHVLLGLALLSTSAAYCMHEVHHLGTEVQSMKEERDACHETVKKQHKKIEELNEKISRAESTLHSKKEEAHRASTPAPAHTAHGHGHAA